MSPPDDGVPPPTDADAPGYTPPARNGNGAPPKLVTVPRVPTTEMVRAPDSGRELANAAVAAQAKAMVEARYLMAMKNPRDIDDARVRLLGACKRPGFAKAARYRKPVGQGIEGPSIRLAEEAARCLKNIAVDIAAIFDDERRRTVRVTATDLEANTTYSKDVTFEKTVERRNTNGAQVIGQRKGSSGQTVYIVVATDDDILNKENALVSKALRTNLLRLVPGDILEEAMAQVYATLRDETAKDPSAERKSVVDAFATLNVLPSALKDYLGHDVGTSSPAEIVDLREVYTTIRDGEATWNEVLEHRRKQREEDEPTAPEAPAAPAAPSAPKAPQDLSAVAAANKAKREQAQAPGAPTTVSAPTAAPAHEPHQQELRAPRVVKDGQEAARVATQLSRDQAVDEDKGDDPMTDTRRRK
jgi:hypothetical protein